MSIQLSGADVVDLAVQAETRGEAFYRAAAAQATGEAQALFAHLADEELRHKRNFEGLAAQIVLTDFDPTAWQETLEYIAATVDSEFFRPDAPIRTVALQDSVPGMIRQAIEFEKQSILFFYTLRDVVQEANRPLVTAILAEERDHVRRLARMLP